MIGDRAIAELLLREYSITGEVSRLAGENDNFLVVDGSGQRHVLKLVGDSQSTDSLELEQLLVETLANSGLGLSVPGIVRTRTGSLEGVYSNGDIEVRGRLVEFVKGTPWCDAGRATSALRADLGACLAWIASALDGVGHPAENRTHRWDLARAHEHRGKVSLVDDPVRRRILDRAFLLYVSSAFPFLEDLPRSLIHGDLNDEHLLVSDGRVVGILDFGDCLENPTVCELAIALTYAVLDEAAPLAAGADVVAGYHRERRLTTGELEVLFPMICGRLAASVAISAERRRIDPEREAWFRTEPRAWRALERLVDIDPLAAAEQLAEGTDVQVFVDRVAPLEEGLERRKRRFSDVLSLTYEEPLKLSRGRAQFLFDERERPYLDMYNNVLHVGHCHPRVVEAGHRQMRRLNTNTRYVHDLMAEYANRLCETLPSELEVCFLLNSGSEANELALQLAWAHTGRKDMLVVDGAYHGHTTTLTDISPYKFMGQGGSGRAEDWVHVVPMADGYRGKFKGQERATGLAHAAEIEKIIASAKGPIAGFITESLLSCAGQVIPPEGYLAAAFEHVRNAGGVCIADEVQVGFGRVGKSFWAFELQDVIPDIVVLGKPIGNGHPMAAVVTTREIADSFANVGMEFFSTCGGNPVSCAIGLAVLDVVRDEGLQQHALVVGTHLRDGLRMLMDRHGVIGDVRGVGLFLGIELVRDRKTLEPAADETAGLVNGLRQLGILTGIDGPLRNVVKLKGPLVITKDDADMFIRAVDNVLTSQDSRG